MKECIYFCGRASLSSYLTCTYKKDQDEIGIIGARNKKEAIIKLIKNSSFVRKQIIFKYNTDCVILERIFCDPEKNYEKSIDKFDKYIDKIDLQLEFDEYLPYIENKLNKKKFTTDERNDLIYYYKNMLKYSPLVSALWGRSDEQLLDLDDVNFERLADIELKDESIILINRKKLNKIN